MKNEATGIKRLLAATRYSMAGLQTTYKSEEAFRQEVWLAVVLIPLAWVVSDSPLEFAVLVASVLILMIVELLNTAVETIVDRIGEEFHELSGRAKDAGSAAVLLTMIVVALVWIAVLFQ